MTDWARETLDYRDATSAPDPHPYGFASCGPRVKVWPLAKIVRPEKIRVAGDCIIDDFVFLDGGQETSIGRYVHIAVGAVLCGGGSLSIGDFSNIASGARVYTGTDDVLEGLVGPTIPPEFRSVTRCATVIGRHCQVLANSVILPGLIIPDGVVVAPGSVVTPAAARKMDDWCVYGGAPAKRLRRPIRSMQEVTRRELMLWGSEGL